MDCSLLLRALGVATVAFGCQSAPSPTAATGWEDAKKSQIPVTAKPEEYEAPVRQPMASLAWEDGVYISRDGLTLYSDYMLCDLLSFVWSKQDMKEIWRFQRGPEIGQDLSNPLKTGHNWIHIDMVASTRKSTSEPFGPWHLTKLSGKYGNLAGVAAIGKGDLYPFVAYTDDITGGTKIKLLRNVGRDLAGDDQGSFLPGNINDKYHADNPHIEIRDPEHTDHLILFFDSDNRPGLGQHDIFYSTSDDGGKSWTGPFPVSTVNSSADEQQPHLFQEKGQWWLYLTATNPKDGKLGIFRYRQVKPGDWNKWDLRELVVSAGTTVSVGEPTLTEDGDLSFVAITVNKDHGTATDKYDCDPWLMKRKK